MPARQAARNRVARVTPIRALILTAVLTGCGGERAATVTFHDASRYPQQLSAWGVISRVGNSLQPGKGVLPYDLATPLFTDYAQKLRTVWMPPGASARYSNDDVFAFPVGTIIAKTFYFPRARAGVLKTTANVSSVSTRLDLDQVRVLETRLLVRQADGWDALPYVWNEAQTDATLEIAGDMKALRLIEGENLRDVYYVVPSRNECASCHASDHTDGAVQPIGPAARHLNKPYAFNGKTGPQLAIWQAAGYLDVVPGDPPSHPLWDPTRRDNLNARARAYLDINCGHCHNPRGAADTSGLFLHSAETSRRRLGVCKPPVAAGRGSGGHRYSIVPRAPDDSILIFRITTNDPGAMMPELGRSIAHEEGVALLRDWINTLDGSCAT